MTEASKGPSVTPDVPVWGACGCEGCTDCRPLYDADNEPIEGTE